MPETQKPETNPAKQPLPERPDFNALLAGVKTKEKRALIKTAIDQLNQLLDNTAREEKITLWHAEAIHALATDVYRSLREDGGDLADTESGKKIIEYLKKVEKYRQSLIPEYSPWPSFDPEGKKGI